jgi:hypothetical protein
MLPSFRPWLAWVSREPRHQTPRVVGAVLPVAVDDEHELAGRPADPALDRRAVPLVVRVRDDRRTGGRRADRRSVGGAVVDDDDLAPGAGARERGDHLADDVRFVVGRDDDRDR